VVLRELFLNMSQSKFQVIVVVKSVNVRGLQILIISFSSVTVSGRFENPLCSTVTGIKPSSIAASTVCLYQISLRNFQIPQIPKFPKFPKIPDFPRFRDIFTHDSMEKLKKVKKWKRILAKMKKKNINT